MDRRSQRFQLFQSRKNSKNSKKPKVNITNFELFYTDIQTQLLGKNPSLYQAVSNQQPVRLSYDQNVFTLLFSANNFIQYDDVSFKFILEGYEEKWNHVQSSRSLAHYTNISPGEYTFKVIAYNKNTIDESEPALLKLVVTPPWWKTNFAYTIYIIALIFSYYLFSTVRNKQIIKQAKNLELKIKQRTEELANEKSKVEKLLSLKNQEIANISHEFRTPLTLILGPASNLINLKLNSDQLNQVKVIQRSGRRLLRMVDQLLTIEVFKLNKIANKHPQPIGKQTQLLGEAFVDIAKQKDIALILDRIDPVIVEFTPDSYEKIIVNLISNSIKYTPSGGLIQVSCKRTKNDQALIEVKDNGIGIPQNQQHKIFERFSRAHNDSEMNIQGVGIGLCLVKTLVEEHGGTIHLQSSVNVGTQFGITFPLNTNIQDLQLETNEDFKFVAQEIDETILNAALPEIEVPIETNEKPCILLIEDNSDMREYIAGSISSDYHVISAFDGEQGIKLANDLIPDLIISDLMMPRKDGYQTTKEIRENDITNHIPIILLTARSDEDSRIKGWKEKADEYITKPFNATELNIRIKNLLEIRNILKQRFSQLAFNTHDLTESQISLSIDNESIDNKNKRQIEFIHSLNKKLESQYNNHDLLISDIALELAMSERQFFRKLKAIINMTPTEYLRNFRLKKGADLLKEGKTVSFVTFEVGFSSQSYFGKCFKAMYGVPPREYREKSEQVH